MDRIEKYREIVQEMLTEYAQIPYAHDNLRDETIFDRVSDKYLLLTIGWQGAERIHTPVLHIDIRDSQVWIQCNNTDQDIVEEFVSKGIPKTDIVIPQSPEINGQNGSRLHRQMV